jgi:nucleoside-diphosphate-sugar epimerase
MLNLLIIGYGDIGARTAGLAAAAGHTVTVAGRRKPATAPQPAKNIRHLTLDLDQPQTLTNLPVAGATMLYLAPPPATGCHDDRVRALCTALSKSRQRPQRLVYISTSGVYGDCGGAVVNEERPPQPQTDRARRRLDAETVLRIWTQEHLVPLIILRVAGIYGPNRLPLERLAAGMAILEPAASPYSNRIHADDLARICLAAAERGADGDLFNVCDGEESRMSDYFIAVAKAFGLPAPRCLDRQSAATSLSPEMLSYLAESRRLDNRRLREDLGVELLYPNLAAGLAAIRHGGQQPE